MAKADVKTPNKRKSFGNDSPAKKGKFENGNKNEKSPRKPFTPKKQGGTPKNNQQTGAQKAMKPSPGGSDSGSPKDVKPFAGIRLKRPRNEGEKKKPRKNQFNKLIVDVKAKSGTKDPEMLKTLNEKIDAIKARPELSKTAKRKLAVLQKMKVVCEEGAEVAAAKGRAKVEAEKAAGRKVKADKKTTPRQVAKGKKQKAAPVKSEDDDDEDSAEEEASDAEESGEEEEDDDASEEDADTGVVVKKDDSEEEEDDDDDDDDDEEEEEDDDDSEEDASSPKGKLPAKKGKQLTDSTSKTQTEKSQQGQNKEQVDLDEPNESDLVGEGEKKFVVYVGNLDYNATKDELISHFSEVGDILNAHIPLDRYNSRPRGFAFVEVKDEIAYQKCMSLHQSEINGRRITVFKTEGGKRIGDDNRAKNMNFYSPRGQGRPARGMRGQGRPARGMRGQGRPARGMRGQSRPARGMRGQGRPARGMQQRYFSTNIDQAAQNNSQTSA